MNSTADIRAALVYVAITIVTYVILQAITIVAHEFVHSTAAWLLGYMPSPLSIVWGNPVTMRGWDEGVPYDQLFPSPGNPAQAVIGASPLVFHTIVVAVGLFVLQQTGVSARANLDRAGRAPHRARREAEAIGSGRRSDKGHNPRRIWNGKEVSAGPLDIRIAWPRNCRHAPAARIVVGRLARHLRRDGLAARKLADK